MEYRVTGAVRPRWVADRVVVLGNGNRSQKRRNRLLWGVLILVLREVVAAEYFCQENETKTLTFLETCADLGG